MDKQEFQHTARSAGLIGVIALAGALVGFVLQLLTAYFFGASHQTDAYFMAWSTSELIGKLLLGGSIASVFLPLFVQRLTQGKRDDAWTLALNLLHVFTIILTIVLLGLSFFTKQFVVFIAPGFSPEAQQLTVSLLRVMMPAFLFLFLSDMAVAMLTALKQFAIPASVRLIAPAVSVLSLVLLARSLGIYALAIGSLSGALIQFLFMLYGLRRQGFHYRWVLHFNDPLLRRLLHLTYPFIFSMMVTQGAGIVYRVLVSGLSEGSLTALKFGEKITQLLTIMFLTSVTTVLYPLLSEKASRRDFLGMRLTLGSAIRLICLVAVPLTIGVAMLREPLTTLVYHHGSFSAHDVTLTSQALLFLVLGLTVNGISALFGYATLALQETRASVAVTIASQGIAIGLFVLLVPRLALAGLALTSSLVPMAIAFLYFLYLTRFIPQLWQVFWHPALLKIAVLAIALAATIQLALPVTHTPILQLMLPTVVGSLVFFGGAQLWHITEMHEIVFLLKKPFRAWL